MTTNIIIFLAVIEISRNIALRQKKLRESEVISVSDEFKKKISSSTFTPILKKEILAVCFESSNKIRYLQTEHLKLLFQMYYNILCEFIGPVDTDKIINSTMLKVNEMEEAIDFNPRELL